MSIFHDMAAKAGVFVNSNNGVYNKGVDYSNAKKNLVGETYKQLLIRPNGCSERELALLTNVGKSYARKVMTEIQAFGDVVPPLRKNSTRRRGIGSDTLDPEDELLILNLLEKDPFRQLSDYSFILLQKHNKSVSNC